MKAIIEDIKELDAIRGGIITDIDPLEDIWIEEVKTDIIIDILEVEDKNIRIYAHIS